VIAVLDYGIGNLRSAEKALQHLEADAELIADPDRAARADGIVLPGVGAFGRCAEELHQSGLDRVATAAVERGVPFLGICVGFQLLYEGSEEDPATAGLGVLSGKVRRLPPGVKHPQMQWNQLVPATGDAFGPGLLAGVPPRSWVYFVHSFAPERTADTTALCDYGGPVTASAERDRVWGTQFHPAPPSG
jgi:glutamine amidotransferase